MVVLENHVTVSRLAANQFGVVSRPQLLSLGLTSRQIERLLGAGALAHLHRGVYAVSAVPPSFKQRLTAACLAGRGAASHRAAAFLWTLRGVQPVVEVSVTNRRRPDLSGVVTHSSDRLQAGDLTRQGPIPLTRPGRTLLDLGAVAPNLVEPALEDAIFRGLVTVGSLRKLLDRVGAHGRRGTAVLREVIGAHVPGEGPTESLLEDALLRVLRAHGLPPPVRQHVLHLADGGVFRLDLAYPELKLAIEADGRQWHSGRAEFQRDRDRNNRLAALGWTTLRFSWTDVHHRGGSVAAAIAHTRRQRLGRAS